MRHSFSNANCAQNPVTGNPNLVLMTESQEIAIGKRADGNVRKQYSIYDDDQLQRYVNEIGRRLAKVSHRPALDYRFLVVDSPEVNAFALPGGCIYCSRRENRWPTAAEDN
jgi:predicted Zn-dependent protease